ncbi:MAG: ribosome maturation factor RimM [Clostridia bacterium]|nr:ribosome maturation factor RimM [Clostridia bacterium]
MSEDRLAVASVLKPQGICGEIKAKVYLDSAEDLKKVKRLYIDGREYEVLHVRGDGDMAYISLKGVPDRNAAELLRGKEIEANRKDLPEPPDGSYYIADLLGCEVVYESGETVGTVSSVIPSRTTIYYLDTPKGELSFVAAEGVILDVDIREKRITVSKKRFKEVSV